MAQNFVNDQVFANNAFSGCDMTVHVNGKQCGSLQAITISITRETLPIYTMGNPSMRAAVRGKRGIAGTLVFSTFDRHSLLFDVLKDTNGASYWGEKFGKILDQRLNEKGYNFDTLNDESFVGLNHSKNTGVVKYTSDVTNSLAQGHIEQEAMEVWNMVMSRRLMYSDSIPPFDVCITMVNEQGNAAWTTINGVYLINEGYGYTMDDLTSEQAFTYIARSVTPLTPFASTETFTGARVF